MTPGRQVLLTAARLLGWGLGGRPGWAALRVVPEAASGATHFYRVLWVDQRRQTERGEAGRSNSRGAGCYVIQVGRVEDRGDREARQEVHHLARGADRQLREAFG